MKGVANRVRWLAAEFDPAAAASLRLRNALTDIQRAIAAGIITTGQAATLTDRLRKEHASLSASAGQVAITSRQAQYALRDFGFQVNDVVSGLAMGQTPMRIFTQQAGQFVQTFQQGGGVSTVLGAVATGIRSWITPTTAAVAGVAALTTGFVALLARASSNAEQLRQFNLILQGTGKDSLTTANNLQQVVRQLRDVGVARDDAEAAVTAIARNPRLNPARAGDIAAAGVDVGARLGIGDAAGVQKFTEAISGGVDGVIKLGFAMSALSASEAANIRDMARHGQQAEALNVAITKVTENLSGEHKRALSDTRESIISLTAAWSQFIDKLSDTRAFEFTRSAGVGLLQSLSELFSGNFKPYSGPLYPGILKPRPGVEGLINPGASLTPGGAVGNVFSTTANASLTSVDPGLVRAFEQTLIETGMRAVITSTTGGSHVAGSMHYPWNTATGLGGALDFNLLDAQGRPIPHAAAHVPGSPAYQAYQQFGAAFARLSGGRSGMDFNDPGHVDFRGRTAGGAASSSFVLPDNAALDASNKRFGDLTKSMAEATANAKLWGVEQRANQAYTQEYNRTLEEIGGSLDEATAKTIADQRAQQVAAEIRKQGNIELQKAATVQDMMTAALLKSADAFRVSEAAGYRAMAEEQARIEVMQKGGDVAERTRQILEESAATAIRAGEQQLAAAQPQIAALEKLADATSQSAAAAHEQELRNQAAAATQDALAKAEASRNPILIAEAKALNDAALAEVKRTDAARQAQQIYAQINQRNDQIAQAQLATSLVGQSPETIAAAVAHLREEQRLLNAGVDLTSEIAKNDLANVDALSAANAQWAEAVRQQQRLEDGVRQIGDAIEQSLTRPIEDAFNGEKVEDWGKRAKSMLGSLASSLTSSLFIRPAIGSVLGAVGLGSLASQYGTFGSLFGGGGAGVGAASAPSVFGSGSIWSVLSGASSISNLSGGGGLFSSTNSFLSKIGSSLGFGGGGIFGDVTLGQALGGAGAGFGAGALLNSLLGGNMLTGSIGSGIGGLAGSLLGSLAGFPILGGIGGGLLGGLAGLFGPKPSVFSSGGAVNLATGRLSSFSSSGNAQNDATVRQIADAIGQFTTALQRSTGGTVGGYISPVASTQGIRLDYGLAGRGSGSIGVGSAEEAINLSKLAIAQELQGVSDTVKKVIDSVSDPANLDAAIQFAATYDKMADAAKAAFSSISTDIEQKGPFEQAKEQITAIFDELTKGATEFGLSLDPVNSALAEATQRLREDFTRSIDQAFNAANGQDFLNQLDAITRSRDQMLSDATALGVSDPRINTIASQQWSAVLKEQTVGDLQVVIDKFRDLNPELASLAENIRDATLAAKRADFASQIEAAFNSASGHDFINQLNDITKWSEQMSSLAAELGASTTQLDATTIEQWSRVLREQTVGDLQLVIDKFRDLNPELAALAANIQSASRASQTTDFWNQVQAGANTASGRGWIAGLHDIAAWRDQLNLKATELGIAVPQGGLPELNEITAKTWDELLKGKTPSDLRAVAETYQNIHPELAQTALAKIPFAQKQVEQQYAVALREPRLRDNTSLFSQIEDIQNWFKGMSDLAKEAGISNTSGLLTSRNTQWQNLLKNSSASDLQLVVDAFKDRYPTLAKLAEAEKVKVQAKDVADFNKQISDELLAVKEPLKAIVEAEKKAGAERLAEARKVGGDIAAVNKLNAAQLNQIWKDQTQSLRDLRNSLVSGDLSGRSEKDLSSAANDNFTRLIGLVRAGDTSQVAAAVQAGQAAVQYSLTAYGNAPQTQALRESIVAALNDVLSHRSFAGGTDWTPPGAIIVGERGPEMLFQRGGMSVAPNVPRYPANDGVVVELRAMRQEQAGLLRAANQIAQSVAAEIIRLLNAQLTEARRVPPIDPPRRKVA